MSDYLADVQRYDAKADADIVQKIVRHLGIALRNRDSSLVSCSDPKEFGEFFWILAMKPLLVKFTFDMKSNGEHAEA